MDGDRRLRELTGALGGAGPVPRPPRLFIEPHRPEPEPAARLLAAAANARSKIWDLSPNYHCAVVGTCLGGAEARRLLAKLGLIDGDTLTEHEVHAKAVILARHADQGGRALNKTLDRLHHAAIGRFAAARDEASLVVMWNDALARADIAGGFWAVLTHPVATAAVASKAFGEVHMLSHLMGAANRADIRRLRQLETEKTVLEDKFARQQARLRDIVLDRDAKTRALEETRAQSLATAPRPVDADSALYDLARDLRRRLEAERASRRHAEQSRSKLETELAAEREMRQLAEREAALLVEELQSAEAHLAAADSDEESPGGAPDLQGQAILYVGGRPNQVPHLRRLSERCAALFLYHEGGEDHGDKLPSLIARSDAVLFPVDCVSHDAAIGLKRLCRQLAKPYIPLRSASLSAFLAALSRISVTGTSEQGS
jgi:Uncharacterized protein conserved in bacteria (DUF2325)